MKINKIAKIIKQRKTAILYGSGDGEQWVGDGGAMYPLEGFPEVDHETLLTILDLNEKQKEKTYHRWFPIKDHKMGDINLLDTVDDEILLEKKYFDIVQNDCTLKPLQTSLGLMFINTLYLEPVADHDYIELYERRTEDDGTLYVAVKAGFMLKAVIMPMNIINEELVEKVMEFSQQLQLAFENQELTKEKESETKEVQIEFVMKKEEEEQVNDENVNTEN